MHLLLHQLRSGAFSAQMLAACPILVEDLKSPECCDGTMQGYIYLSDCQAILNSAPYKRSTSSPIPPKKPRPNSGDDPNPTAVIAPIHELGAR